MALALPASSRSRSTLVTDPLVRFRHLGHAVDAKTGSLRIQEAERWSVERPHDGQSNDVVGIPLPRPRFDQPLQPPEEGRRYRHSRAPLRLPTRPASRNGLAHTCSGTHG
jgi:hypothetical protein